MKGVIGTGRCSVVQYLCTRYWGMWHGPKDLTLVSEAGICINTVVGCHGFGDRKMWGFACFCFFF